MTPRKFHVPSQFCHVLSYSSKTLHNIKKEVCYDWFKVYISIFENVSKIIYQTHSSVNLFHFINAEVYSFLFSTSYNKYNQLKNNVTHTYTPVHVDRLMLGEGLGRGHVVLCNCFLYQPPTPKESVFFPRSSYQKKKQFLEAKGACILCRRCLHWVREFMYFIAWLKIPDVVSSFIYINAIIFLLFVLYVTRDSTNQRF